MNKYLVYVKKFKGKRELTHDLKEGRVYEAIDDGELMNILMPDGNQFIVHKTVQSGDAFDAEIVQLTAQNHSEFDYTTDDQELVMNTIFGPMIKQAVKERQDQQTKVINNLQEDIIDLTNVDSEIVEALGTITKHIKKTYEDKYEEDMFPAVDLYGLMRHSFHGRGYNIGNASKYLKRYLTDGYEKSANPSDLLKATHYILFEICRLNNMPDEK
jgi:hypothetical protein